jgi:hypothetical protein
MKYSILVTLCTVGLLGGCKSTPDANSDVETFNSRADADVRAAVGAGFLTVEKLQSLSDQELFALIRDKGVSQICLPTMKSVGKPGRMETEKIRTSNLTKILFSNLFKLLGNSDARRVADALWKGKTFTSEVKCKNGAGSNRITLLNLITLKNRIMTRDDFLDEIRYEEDGEKEFVRALEENKNGVNMVELNYSDPKNDPLNAGKDFGIRDLMVPIRQPDNTVIYIGRAYVGKWTSPTDFVSDGLLAWFFLDFSKRALAAEKPFD